MIGLWIDGLTDEQRDRIVAGQGWWYSNTTTPGTTCLLGHIEGGNPDSHEVYARYCGDARLKRVMDRYDTAKKRFGLDRVVRAIKARAAALRSSDVERPPVEAPVLPGWCE